MRVKLKKNKRISTLSNSNVYDVISILFMKDTPNYIQIRVLNEDGVPILCPLSLFEILDNGIRRKLSLVDYTDSVELIPMELSAYGYWEDFFNLHEKPIELFKKVFPKLGKKLRY